MNRTSTCVVVAMLLGLGALSLAGSAAAAAARPDGAAAAARPSVKGVWVGRFAGQTLGIRITTFRKPIAGRLYFASQYDGSPGSFESADCEISLRYQRRKGLRYYFRGSFKTVGLGCPVSKDTSSTAHETVVLQRSGKGLVFQTKVEGEATRGKLKRSRNQPALP